MVGIVSLNTFYRDILKNKRNRNILNERSRIRGDYYFFEWYKVCMQSMFQPSEYLIHYLEPYYQKMKNHKVIGMHIRQGGNLINWKDSQFHITEADIIGAFPHIDKIIRKNPDALIFVASDSKELISLVIHHYGKRVFGVDRYEATHVGKHPTMEGLLRVSMELVLLSKCDYLFLTAHSGMSDCGYRLNSKVNEVVYLNRW